MCRLISVRAEIKCLYWSIMDLFSRESHLKVIWKHMLVTLIHFHALVRKEITSSKYQYLQFAWNPNTTEFPGNKFPWGRK